MMPYTAEQTANIHQHTFAYIQVSESEHSLNIKLNRPAKKNAMTPTTLRELAFAMSYAHHQSHIWGIILSAAGDVFCAGMDLKSFREAEAPNDSDIPHLEQEVVLGDLFYKVHRPVIASVQGSVYAGGFLLVGGAHYVIAVEDAKFMLPEVKRGIWPMQVSAMLMQFLPARKVLDMSMRALKLTAQEALEIGLATHVVAADQLQVATAQLQAEIFVHSPTAIRMGLKAYDEMRSISLHEHQPYLKGLLAENLQSEDAKEGIAAFFEKREARWTGR